MRASNRDRLDLVPTHVTGLLGLLGCLAGTWWLRGPGARETALVGGVVLATATAAPMLLHDLWRRVFLRPSAGLGAWGQAGAREPARWAVKLAGLAGTFAVLAAVYLLFPEYRGELYRPFFELCRWAVPVTLLLSLLYIPFVDRRMAEPEDGYFHAGLFLLGRFRRVDSRKLRFHCLGWLIKGFFLPLMFGYLLQNVGSIQSHPFADPRDGFGPFFDWSYNFVFTVDLLFGVVGYSLTLRLFDAQIRRPETTALGWISALLCYYPFWGALERRYFAYDNLFAWGLWLKPHPVLYVVWGSVLLLVLTLFVWATVVFGLRFSNLTHRGIVVFGPYAVTKHPAYVTKLVSFAMISVPFVPLTGAFPDLAEAARRCAALALLAFVYWVRAWTEERNLGHDRAYRVYSRWMRRRHDRWLFRPLRRLTGRAAQPPADPGLAA